MATLVQSAVPVHSDPHTFRLNTQQQRPQHPQQHSHQQQHHHHQQHMQQQQTHHHHHHFHHHHQRQSAAPQSYAAAVPVIYQPPGAIQAVQPNVYKQINIIPGLDPENAIVDTGVKLFRPSVNQTQGQNQQFEYDGKRMRRSIQRRTVDYNASTIQMMKHRLYKRSILQKPVIQPDALFYTDIVQPKVLLHNPVYSVTTRFVRASTNKVRCPVFTVAWTPEGRRVVTGTSSGEFTLWNGLTFNFETILQAHDCAVRAMEWSHNDMWLLSGDHNGVIKYWQSNMNNVKMIQAHNDPIRGLSFCPTDNKFVTCSDDGLIKVWDFYRCVEERVLRGHGADVKCVGWHPSKCMVASGSKDSQQPLKLWDPRSATSLATIHSHKSTVMDLHWNKNGNWLLSGSRDRLIKVFDIRVMKEISTFRGHKKEAASVNWHPVYEEMFASGGSDGSIMFWLMGCDKELGCMENSHEGMIWDLKWHPLGHILCSGSNDHTTKFWTRNRPGDKMRDKYNLNVLPAGYEDDYEYEIPNMSQSDDDHNDSILNSTLNTLPKNETNMEQYERPDLDSPAVKALLEQATLEVTKAQNSEVAAQIFTVTRNSELLSPKFKIDAGRQQEAIEEVERLEKKREKLLRQGIERTKRRKVAMDETCAIADSAPSLLDMNIEVPHFLKGQEWEEGDEPFIEDAKQRAAEMAGESGEPTETWNEDTSPEKSAQTDHGPRGSERQHPPPNFNRPSQNGTRFSHYEHDNFEDQQPLPLRRPQFEGGPRGPHFEGGPRGPQFEGRPRGPHFEGGPRGPRFEGGPRGPHFEGGPRGLRFEAGQRRPQFEGGPRGPHFEGGPRGPRFEGGPRGPRFEGGPPGNFPPRDDWGRSAHHFGNEDFEGPMFNEPLGPQGAHGPTRFNEPPPHEGFEHVDNVRPPHPNDHNFINNDQPPPHGHWGDGIQNEHWADDHGNR